jgi:hypothetical protein
VRRRFRAGSLGEHPGVVGRPDPRSPAAQPNRASAASHCRIHAGNAQRQAEYAATAAAIHLKNALASPGRVENMVHPH